MEGLQHHPAASKADARGEESDIRQIGRPPHRLHRHNQAADDRSAAGAFATEAKCQQIEIEPRLLAQLPSPLFLRIQSQMGESSIHVKKRIVNKNI
jgi:hypothetical protein